MNVKKLEKIKEDKLKEEVAQGCRERLFLKLNLLFSIFMV